MSKHDFDPFSIFLTKPVRIGINIFLILNFLIISPIVILHTIGYSYNWQKQQIEQTGSLSIDIKPNDADVYLNNILIAKKLPVELKNRHPGNYQLKIEKNGYKTWQKNITIKSKETTYIKNIQLYKNNLPTKLDIAENLNKLIGNQFSSNFLLIKKNNTIYEIINYQPDKNQKTTVLRLNSEKPILIDQSPYSDLILIKTQNNQEQHYYLISLDKTDYKINFLNTNENINWLWSDDKNLYFQLNKTIYQVKNNQIIKKFKFKSEKTKIWYLSHNHLFYKQADIFFDLNLNNLEKNIYLKNNLNCQKIVYLNNKTLITSDQNYFNFYFLNDKQEIQNQKKILGQQIIFNPTKQNFIIWSDIEIWNYNLNQQEVNFLTRSDKKIQQILFLDQYELGLILDNVLIAFNPGYNYWQELFKFNKIDYIFSQPQKRRIYFSGQIGKIKGLFKLVY